MNDPRWYCVNSFGVALLCCDKEGAEIEAEHMDRVDSKHAPHRAVQLVDAAEAERLQKRVNDLEQDKNNLGIA